MKYKRTQWSDEGLYLRHVPHLNGCGVPGDYTVISRHKVNNLLSTH